MRILHIVQKSQLRGAEIFASQSANHMLDAGHEVMMVTLFEGGASLPFKGKIIHLDRPPGSRLVDFTGWKTLNQIVGEFKPDIVQANAADTLKYAVFSKRIFRWNAPIVYRNASMVSRYLKSSWQKVLYRFLFNATDGVISVSKSTADDLSKLFPNIASKVSVVPVGVDINQIGNPSKGKKSTNKVILHVGGFSFEKNHFGLLNIYKQIKREWPDACLHLVGDGPLRKTVESKAQALGLEDISFFGSQRDVSIFFEAADVMVLPSIIEGLPAVVLEAFLNRVPVVAYDVGAIGEIIMHGKSGWLVPEQNENEFAKATIEALTDTNKRTEMTRFAFEYVTQNFNNRFLAGKFVQVYQSILEMKSNKTGT